MDDSSAAGREHRPHAREIGGVAAHHRAELAGGGEMRAARDGCVEQPPAAQRERLAKVADGLRTHGAVHDHRRPGLDRIAEAAVAVGDCEQLDVVAHAHRDHLRRLDEIGAGRRETRARVLEGSQRLGMVVVHRELEFGPQVPPRHWRADVSEPDKAQSHERSTLLPRSSSISARSDATGAEHCMPRHTYASSWLGAVFSARAEGSPVASAGMPSTSRRGS